ncbi:Nop52-domain-containing protein [Ceraceosorus guamensis]|uniref:Nop52-domain-containing protein n=1 Tax=Ceraceosorus guamensis TaxID=1522189 RepID=A0A316VRC0_9BASI|nr:Nop52-domain-containing protein [Ceraceosorus guamensis]PWN40157.1 Nop52-domain-containing protein [Ceraceosorus guamensis]
MSAKTTSSSGRGASPVDSRNKKRRLERSSEAPSPSAELPLGRYLASPDKRTRDQACQSLKSFLTQRRGQDALPKDEMAKLWKGIFYCFWMSDKPRVQQALAQELADLVLAIPPTEPGDAEEVDVEQPSLPEPRCAPALAFLDGFWDAMIREWSALDKWRMDKFYLLLRRFLNAGLRLVERERWDAATVDELYKMMRKSGGCLDTNNPQVPDSIAYHLADIYLDELERALTAAGRESSPSAKEPVEHATISKSRPVTPLVLLLQPFVDTIATTHNATVYTRLYENVVEPVLADCLVLGSASDKEHPSSTEEEDLAHPEIIKSSVDGEATLDAGENLRARIFESLFKTASLPSANGARRAKLYRLWEAERARLEE